MFSQFEEKGKIYTNVIQKKPVPAIIQTNRQRLLGKVYIRPEDRLIDEMNRNEPFLAVTDVLILNDAGEVTMHVKFMAVQRSQIIWITPQEETENTGTS